MFSTLSRSPAAARTPATFEAQPPARVEPAQAAALRHVAAAVCPVSRQPIHAHGGEDAAGVVALDEARGWQPGNLAVLGAPARHAIAAVDVHEALAHAAAPAATARGGSTLEPAQWRRLAVLLSFVTPLPHAVAATLPLAVLPPPGVRPVNAIQALQWLLTREFARREGCARVRLLGQGLGETPLAHDYYRFAAALLPRLIEARRLDDALLARQACEDAWLQPLVHKLWQRLALQLDARRTRCLLRHALRHGIGGIGGSGDVAAPARRDARPRRTPRGAARRSAPGVPAGRAVASARRQANTATS